MGQADRDCSSTQPRALKTHPLHGHHPCGRCRSARIQASCHKAPVEHAHTQADAARFLARHCPRHGQILDARKGCLGDERDRRRRCNRTSLLEQLDELVVAHDMHPRSSKYLRLMVRANQLSRLDSLDWWLSWHKGAKPKVASRPFPMYDARVLIAASAAGHVAVLDWWRNSGFKFDKYLCQPLDQASANGHVAMLWWWYRNSRKHLSLTMVSGFGTR
ncbi:hypothetical protein BCR44DRAFT_34820 [Catenaria anguillulae PL171]|uniref:Ankyrin repeat-containing domain protein n=1 Tax=Catenaria anguillulae PL171 TaxID=765915 RepID=A0A1Y2I4G9_9FUNG|nr:hypothetical protein BCR44DRAFT_34820 [Catenaria anguillulae PL171]